MPITFHGHRPSWVCRDASAAHGAAARPANLASGHDEPARTVNLGFFKIKIHRQPATQAALMTMMEQLRHQADAAPTQPGGVGAAPALNLPAELNEPSQRSMSQGEVPIGEQDNTVTLEATVGRPQSREEFVAHWNEWARAGGTTGGNRTEAVTRMTAWFDHRPTARAMDLSSLGLTSLPDYLPSSLASLHVDNNQLTCLPDSLPNSLVVLYAYNNQLTGLPEHLPDSLHTLNVSGNQLARLPEHLPSSLAHLTVSNNRLTHLPDRLPGSLGALHANNNLLTRLPERLPNSLIILVLDDNRLTSLPEDISTQLSDHSMVSLMGNPLPQRVMSSLSSIMNAQDYRGPTFFFSMATAPAHEPVRPLADAVAAWFEPGDQAAMRQAWSALSDAGTEQGQVAFSKFLDRLGRTVNAGNPQFTQAINEWLSHLTSHAPLRNDTFLISLGATTSCEDRISLTFNDMKKARLAADVESGAYDQRLPDLIGLARGMFRLDKLESIAREKTKSLRFVDEIEVYLAYQVKLREPLSLPLDTPDMRFFDVSYVKQSDLDLAQESIRDAETKEFSDYLSTDWAPWQSVMKRLDPARVEAANQQLMDALETQFPYRLHARLQELGLGDDSDAQRTVGAVVQAEINREIKGELTRAFLKAQNSSELLP